MRDGSSKLSKQGRLSYADVLSWDLLSKDRTHGRTETFLVYKIIVFTKYVNRGVDHEHWRAH